MSGMLINLIIQIVAGAIDGNVAGAASKDMSLGTVGNSITGAIGGGVGEQLLGAFIPLLANTASTVDVSALIGQAAGGGVAGAALTGIVGLIKTRWRRTVSSYAHATERKVSLTFFIPMTDNNRRRQ